MSCCSCASLSLTIGCKIAATPCTALCSVCRPRRDFITASCTSRDVDVSLLTTAPTTHDQHTRHWTRVTNFTNIYSPTKTALKKRTKSPRHLAGIDGETKGNFFGNIPRGVYIGRYLFIAN